jgi:hypothetical protein
MSGREASIRSVAPASSTAAISAAGTSADATKSHGWSRRNVTTPGGPAPGSSHPRWAK